jgi:LysM repeat protein
MKNTAFILFGLISFLSIPNAYASKITRKEYISMYKNEAISDMHRFGVPASIKLAQGILESDNGNSKLARTANNHFGIKCHDWTGPKVYYDDDAKNECFRKYRTVLESYDDHSQFLKTRTRYSFLFEYKSTDYKAWAYGLKKAGYATNPQYPQLLINLIEDNELYQYDSDYRKPAVFVKKQTSRTGRGTPVSGIKIRNNRKSTVANAGENYRTVAERVNVMPWQVLKYNDLKDNTEIKEGDVIYLQPKRNKANKDFHIVQAGETLHYISQQYGIKMKSLCSHNKITADTPVVPGQKLWLKRPRRS